MEKKLNPFTQQCHLVPYVHKDGSVTISVQFAVEELVRRANSDPKVHHVGNGDLMVRNRDGNIERMNGCIASPDAQLIGAVCTVYFADGSTEDYSVSLRMYTNQARHWTDVGFMLTKCARAHACRCVAPDLCGGVYTAGELPSSAPQASAQKPARTWEELHPEKQPATEAPTNRADNPVLDLGVTDDSIEDATFHDMGNDGDPNELGPPIENWDGHLNPGNDTSYEPGDDGLPFGSRANQTTGQTPHPEDAARQKAAKATKPAGNPFNNVGGTARICFCGKVLSEREEAYCDDHAGELDGKDICYKCQHPDKAVTQ